MTFGTVSLTQSSPLPFPPSPPASLPPSLLFCSGRSFYSIWASISASKFSSVWWLSWLWWLWLLWLEWLYLTLILTLPEGSQQAPILFSLNFKIKLLRIIDGVNPPQGFWGFGVLGFWRNFYWFLLPHYRECPWDGQQSPQGAHTQYSYQFNIWMVMMISF